MLHVSDFTFTYPGTSDAALEGVSLSAERGEAVGIVGPVGAGKTTLCMALAGFVPRITGGTATGTLEVGDLNPASAAGDEMAERVGMVFEDFSAQLTQVRVLEEVAAPLVNRGVPRDEAEERARELLAAVGMEDVDPAEKRTWELSGGQQQRVAIAAILAADPDVLIFDDATGMLDPRGTERVGELIDDLAGETTLVVVDEPDFLAGTVDRIVAMDDGEVVADGPAETLLRDANLLAREGIDPPTPLQVAHRAGLSDDPLTPDEFEAAVGDREVAAPRRVAHDGFGRTRLRIEDAVYEYGDGTRAIDGATLDVHAGEVHAIIGGNGAGKTTLSKLVAGLVKPDEGRVLVDGTDTREETAADLARTVGTAFQDPDEQISEATVRDEIAYPLEERRYEKTGWFSKRERFTDADIDEAVARACELVGLDDDLLDRDPALLPRGMRRMVTIAESLALDPDVVVLDEPTVGLDPDSRDRVAETIADLRAACKTVVLVEHDMNLVCEAADTVTLLDGGEVTASGPTRTVFSRENWDRLAELDVKPPRAARLAERVGSDALTRDELATHVSATGRGRP